MERYFLHDLSLSRVTWQHWQGKTRYAQFYDFGRQARLRNVINQEHVEYGPHDKKDGVGGARLHLVEVVLHV